jgi:xanthine dehydrogenase large subunit
VGFDDDGRILGLDVMLASRCGYSVDFSGPVNDRAVLHIDNCYHLPQPARGEPPLQDEHAVQHGVPRLRRAAGHVRHRDGDRGHRAQLGRTRWTCAGSTCTATRPTSGEPQSMTTPYGQVIEDFVADRHPRRAGAAAATAERRAQVRAFNAAKPHAQARPGARRR